MLHAVEDNKETLGVSWHISSFGDNVLNSDGFNKWTSKANASSNYLSLKTSSKRTVDVINQLMLEPGAK